MVHLYSIKFGACRIAVFLSFLSFCSLSRCHMAVCCVYLMLDVVPFDVLGRSFTEKKKHLMHIEFIERARCFKIIQNERSWLHM